MKKTERRTRSVVGKSAQADPMKASSTATQTDQSENLNLSEIKQLIELISEKEFNEFELEQGGFRLRLQKGLSKIAAEAAQSLPPTTSAAANSAGQNQVDLASHVNQSTAPPVEEKLHLITSPIVGTYYSSPSPAAEPFIKLGDVIETGNTLCIIEAMKLMNEIQSDVNGAIAKIFVENGQPVEYGQPLFGIKI